MFEDPRKASELQLSTITNINASTLSGDENIETDPSQPQNPEISSSDFPDIEVESNNIEGEIPDEENPIQSPKTPTIPQFWWLWKRKPKKPTTR